MEAQNTIGTGMRAGQAVPRLLVSPREAAKALAVCEKTLWNLRKRGEIPAVRIGRTVQRVKDDLGIKPYRDQFGGAWIWRLPTDAARQDASCHDPQDTENLASWHLRDNAAKNRDSDVAESLSCQISELGTVDAENVQKTDGELMRELLVSSPVEQGAIEHG